MTPILKAEDVLIIQLLKEIKEELVKLNKK